MQGGRGGKEKVEERRRSDLKMGFFQTSCPPSYPNSYPKRKKDEGSEEETQKASEGRLDRRDGGIDWYLTAHTYIHTK